MAAPEVYIGHASPPDDGFCDELVAALRNAGVRHLHYEKLVPQTGTLTVIVVGELRSRPVNIYLLSPDGLRNALVQQWAEEEHKRLRRDPLRILLPVVIALVEPSTIWPFLQGYWRVEAAPGKPYPTKEAIRYTLQALALAPVTPPGGFGRILGRGSPFTPDPLVSAKALHWQGRNDEALSALEQAAQQKHTFDAWYSLAVLRDDLKQGAAALAAYDRALALDPNHAEAWVKKGYVLDLLQQYEAGLQACDRALALNPDLGSAWHIKGYILDDLDRLEEALAAYQKALEIEPTLGVGWSNMGITLRKMGRLDEAKAAQERAIQLDDQFAPARGNLANVLLDGHHYAEALDAAEKAIALDPRNPIFQHAKGRALIGLKRYPEALSTLIQCGNFPPAVELRTRLQRAMQGG